MTLELEIDVPESREVTLPPEVPVGRSKVTLWVRPADEQVVDFHVTLPDEPPLLPTADKFDLRIGLVSDELRREPCIPPVWVVRDGDDWDRYFEPHPHFVRE